MAPLPKADRADETLDILSFALAPRPGRVARLNAALAHILRRPGDGLAILRARLSGKRLRARQGLAALVGIDHDLALPPSRIPEWERESTLADQGIALADAFFRALPGDAPLIALTAPGHAFAEGAGAAIAAAFADEAVQVVYGDALVQLEPGGPLLPVLRPAFDRDYLRAADYTGPVLVLRRSCLEALGSERVRGAEGFDLLLRAVAAFGEGAVHHLPRVLSLWQPWRGKPVAIARAARLRAVRRDLERDDEGARAEEEEDGVIRVIPALPEPWPKVSLIVPTRDRLDLLQPCIASLIARTDWPDKEILILDNSSREPATFAYFREVEATGAARIVPWPGPFDFAAMNNAAAAQARGQVLAFVNNDVEAFRADWLERMVREALRPEVGAVGAKLLDGEGRIQHGGIVLGTGGLVTHGHRHFPGDAPGYLCALRATRQVAAVTAACLVIEREKFLRVGGFEAEGFAVDFNDVDLCLRLNALGLRSLLVPGAVLHHREASSRRWTDDARARHEAEIARFRQRWGALLDGVPHYHPGFDPGLSTHARLRAGWTGMEALPPR